MTALATTARKAERGLIRARDFASNILDRVQLRLHAAAVARDPETKRWADEMRERVRNGSIAKDIELEERAREHRPRLP